MIIKDYMDTVGLRSTEASHELQSLSTDDKNKLLLSIADSIRSKNNEIIKACLLYTSPSPRDATLSRMPSSA